MGSREGRGRKGRLRGRRRKTLINFSFFLKSPFLEYYKMSFGKQSPTILTDRFKRILSREQGSEELPGFS